MNPGDDKERFERVLRWMTTNLEVSSSVYHTAEGTLRVLPGLTITPDGNAMRSDAPQPADFREWQLTSAAALIACCYIDALGKVVTKNARLKPDRNLQRFQAFVTAHMGDFTQECGRKGAGHSVEVLYARYRCGFVHQFADLEAHWGRRGPDQDYWFARSAEPALNVDRFVRGVIEAIHGFRQKFPNDPKYGPNQYSNFSAWLLGA